MSKYWSEITKRVEPYTPGEQPKERKYIKLNTNENPYPPSPRVLEAIKNNADERLRLYPQASGDDLRDTVAQYYKLDKNQVFVGNGSDEVLAFSFMAFFNPGKPILFPDITYSFYPVYSELFGLDYEVVYLNEEFNIPEEDFYKENGGIVISNPKSPTAQDMPLDSIRKILDKNKDCVVIIDEAYIDFGGETAIPLINDYPNLLIVQTLSKSRCLAGLRVGLAMGHKDLIEGLDRIKNSFNSYPLDRLAIAGAVEAFKDEDYFRETLEKVIKTRNYVSLELRKLNFTVTDSKANFIFISHQKFSAETLFKYLREKGILVRYFNKPRIDNYLRVSIGNEVDMQYFLDVIKELISA